MRRRRQQPHDGERGDRFAGARFADQRQRLARVRARSETPSTASVSLPPCRRRWRGRGCRGGERSWNPLSSPESLSRIEGVAHRLADEDQQRQQQRDDGEAGQAEPGRLQIGFALQQQFAERRRARRQAEAEKIQRGQRRDRGIEDEGQEGQGRDRGVGQQMPQDDLGDWTGRAPAPRSHIRNCARAGIRRAPHAPATPRRTAAKCRAARKSPASRNDEMMMSR